MTRIIILQLIFVQATSGNIVITPKVPEVNQTATISCFKPASRTWYMPFNAVLCSNVECQPDAYGSYIFRADLNKTDFIFQSLNRTRDQRVWACQHGDTNYSISLLIYTIPRGLDLTQAPDKNVDLGIMSVTIQCRTTSCTYPEPSIEWLYQDQPTSITYEVYTRSIPSSTQGPCILPEKIYTGSISISQYTTWSDNSDKTVTFFCRIGYSDPLKNITSLASKPVSFAVNVSSVSLDGSVAGKIVFTEGYPGTLKCISSPSRPMPIIRWFLGNNQVTDNITNSDIIDTNGLHVLTSEVTLVVMRNSSNQKVYCEGFISGQGTTAVSTQVSVDVRYAPDVKVITSEYTAAGSSAVLMCVSQGNPPQYTFHHWIHRVGQTEIRRLDGINTSNFSTLLLSNISIQDMGTYICTVDNSITGLDGQMNQMGDTHVYVQGVPFIGETDTTFTVETNNSAKLEIPFYSYLSIKTVKFIRHLDSFEMSNTSNVSIFIQPSNITMMFYKKKVSVPGHVAVLHFRNVKDTDFDNYTLEVSNDLGTVSMQFDFLASAPPSLPKKCFFSHIEGSFLVFGLEKGFNGGHEEAFIVEYQPFGMSEASWSTTSKINDNDLDDPFSNGTYYFKIPKIQDGQFIFRVYAENKKGKTSTIDCVHVVEIKTELLSAKDVPVGAVVGGVVGAILLVIAIVVVVVIVKRRNLKPKMTGLRKNPVYDSSDSGPVMQVDTAGVKPKRMFGYAEDPSKLYAQVDKTNKKNKGKGDVYENAPLPLKSSAENAYENPEASASRGQLVNNDDLQYADLKFGSQTKKAGKPVIHGEEDRTEYAEIAYGKRGEPLPETD